jgi:hypothetical protein
MYPNWDIAFGGTALIGLVLAIVGAVIAVRKETVPLFSIIGGILNLAPVWFMLGIFAMGSMH